MRRADIRLTNDCTISVISDNIKIDSFSCGDRELDEYFKERSVRYTSEHTPTTASIHSSCQAMSETGCREKYLT